MQRKVPCRMDPGYNVYINSAGYVSVRKGEKHAADECLPLMIAL